MAAMTEWVAAFDQTFRASEEESEKLPFLVSTNSGASQANPVATYISKKVYVPGGAQAQVIGIFEFNVTAGGLFSSGAAANSYSEEAVGKLRVTFPGGSTFAFGSNQLAKLRVVNQVDPSTGGGAYRSTVASRATVSFSWPIEAKFQTGGEHTFAIRTSGSGRIESGQMTVQVF